ncbi:PEGA domain-containing protein [Methanospirillum sp. J.3.6.1-F.2.7.3]|uniref:PEGA domain-containing protein n=1 Tax=Methanospirillum purgamenti TaxID=2834276 RepID=A0A8E7AXZ7_9EURY|nr:MULTISPECIES: PEGA domain-containing protein [Methanospirillum]MDX8551486.1 PEGA domain-containing protein [Methanospirillum hungatei]QVV88339.1 PEGA domain-containing protein [Methanospirillum sp. J.3.6.1-F.2.7.3]
MNNIFIWMTGALICMCILSGTVSADYSDDNTMMFVDQQGSGIAEPFYPASPPSPDMYSTPYPTQGPFIPEQNNAGMFVNPGNSDTSFTPNPSNIVLDVPAGTVLQSEPVQGSYQDPGTAEPYYPSNPPSPGTSDQPIQISPVTGPYQDPGSAVPYYPTYPPTPEPTPTPYPRDYSSPVYYPSYRYQEPTVIHHWYDDDRSWTYRPTYYDKYDRDYYSYDRYRGYDYYTYVDGTLKIASEPYQAEVYVDNRFRGYTPYSGYLTLNDIRPGTYTIRLKYSGYYDYYEDVYISRGRTTYVDADMVRIGERYSKSGSMNIQSEPTGASVYLDNEYRGFSPVMFGSVSPGEHTLLIRKDGYADYVSKVTITDKQTVMISAVLSRLNVPAEATPSPTPIQTPVPEPTKSGIFTGIICFAVIFGGIFILRKKS